MELEGFYTDGRSAHRQQVHVQVGRLALHLHGEDGTPLAEWPYAGLYLAEEAYGKGPVRLRHRERGEGLLTLPGPAVLLRIFAAGGPDLRGRRWHRPTLAAGLGAGLLAIVLGVALVWWAPSLVAPLARFVPPAWEQALGERVAAALAQGEAFCTDPAGTAALERLTGRLAPQAGLPYPVQVHVAPGGAVNAFAAPGGQLVVMDGLLRQAESADEVAGVLAHELAHAANRHPLQGMIRVMGIGLLLSALIGDTGALESIGTRAAHALVLTSYTRQDELAADEQAVRMLNAADIRGDGLANLLRRLSKRNAAADALPALLSTHPANAERIALIEREARGTGAAMSPADWTALRSICRGASR